MIKIYCVCGHEYDVEWTETPTYVTIEPCPKCTELVKQTAYHTGHKDAYEELREVIFGSGVRTQNDS